MKCLIRPQGHIFVVVFIAFCVSGCSDTEPKTRIAYHITALNSDESGTIHEGRQQSNEAVFNDNLHESSMDIMVGENEKVGITIKPAAGKSAHVTISHNERSKQLEMTEGQIKNVFFDDSDVGVRIHVKEIKQ